MCLPFRSKKHTYNGSDYKPRPAMAYNNHSQHVGRYSSGGRRYGHHNGFQGGHTAGYYSWSGSHGGGGHGHGGFCDSGGGGGFGGGGGDGGGGGGGGGC
ncbi:hypothetical protein CI238_00555 [Colletotrichum incanum]|uniref:Uncharacterized protein n=1 Tax=Colletotrichum incanum TaxID=1573173 RepID=A0A161VFB7_COLIC|nr:hypothetical protein CI238_00555 [Colletotrichum incanum]